MVLGFKSRCNAFVINILFIPEFTALRSPAFMQIEFISLQFLV